MGHDQSCTAGHSLVAHDTGKGAREQQHVQQGLEGVCIAAGGSGDEVQGVSQAEAKPRCASAARATQLSV